MSLYDLSPAAKELLATCRDEIKRVTGRGDVTIHEVLMILHLVEKETVDKADEN